MKNIFYTIFCVLVTSVAFSQPGRYIGTWEGDVDAGVQKLRLVFTISQKENALLKLTMQSPQQSAMQMPADTAYISADNSIYMEIKKYGISFKGTLSNDSTISGNFVQGMPFPLQLKKVAKPTTVTKIQRPQTPRPPFSYQSRDVSFTNKDNSIQFGATLTLPDTNSATKFPAVILITGSGAQDRDETIMGHKPFAVIADHLTKSGIAVLRVDDRGVGKTTGKHATSTSGDFADDKEAALDYLKTVQWVDAKRIGLIGHSEGGMIAPLLASKRKDIKAIVLLAGPGVTGFDLLAEQNVAIHQSSGVADHVAEMYGIMFKKITKAILDAKDTTAAIHNGTKVLDEWNAPDSVKLLYKVATAEDKTIFSRALVLELYNDWFRYFLNYDPAPVLKKLSCKVLALNGSKDIQVLAASNLAGIKAALQKSRSKSYLVKEIEGLNHLFQTCKTCTLEEYGTLEETFSPVALDIVKDWLKENL